MDEFLSGEVISGKEEPSFNFATVGQIFSDGVTLIFDGQTAATGKHYKCNTSAMIRAGDRVKICKDSGTYVVEYAVGAPNSAGGGIPSGGKLGAVLTKKSASDGDVQWSDKAAQAVSADSVANIMSVGTSFQIGASYNALVVLSGGIYHFINFDS